MNGDKWEPLSVRTGKDTSYDALHEGIPPWLARSVWSWVAGQLGRGQWDYDKLHEIERRCRLQLDWRQGGESAVASLARLMEQEPEKFLDVVDLLIKDLPSTSFGGRPSEVEELAIMLNQAGSSWRVVVRDWTPRLERRVPDAVAATAQQVMSSAGKAGEHLTLAWEAVYGRSPDPGKAYSEAVKALEVAAQPVITPADTSATLGKMIAAFRDGRGKWEFALKPTSSDPHEAVLQMMRLLWTGQTDRHGTADPGKPLHVSPEEAEAAVHLAVTLVQWFDSGAVRAQSGGD